jgi:hypothetical protein
MNLSTIHFAHQCQLHQPIMDHWLIVHLPFHPENSVEFRSVMKELWSWNHGLKGNFTLSKMVCSFCFLNELFLNLTLSAGRPTEVYCTDFIHKVKQEKPSRYQAYSENPRSLLKITDKWREEWSANGVQMPLGNIRDEYEFEATEMFPELPEAKLFEP